MIRPYTDLDGITGRVIRCAIEVHRVLGPGLLESVYHECLLAELKADGLAVQCELKVPIAYKGLRLSSRLEVDLLVEQQVIVELKSVESLLPVHAAQVITSKADRLSRWAVNELQRGPFEKRLTATRPPRSAFEEEALLNLPFFPSPVNPRKLSAWRSSRASAN